jgi:radical SAM protein with 4Fe4S-binding SPASM domain
MERPACAGLWHTPMVHVNGDVTTCCLDERLENRLGNVRETPLAELWNGPVVEAWRLAHAEGRFADSGPYCTRCNWRSAGALPDADLAAWKARRGVRRAAGSAS